MKKNNPLILHIETATEICSVALSQGDLLLQVIDYDQSFSHAEKLMELINEVLEGNRLKTSDLDAVAVSIGPGSYTGLRIGVSTVKGLAYAMEIPVIAISTLSSIALGAKKSVNINGSYKIAPMIDARRMEVYTALYDWEGVRLNEVHSEILDENSFREFLVKEPILFCGNGSNKFKPLVEGNSNALFSDATLSAQNMVQPALIKYKNEEFEDTAYFEPFYLKDYIPVKSTVKGLYSN